MMNKPIRAVYFCLLAVFLDLGMDAVQRSRLRLAQKLERISAIGVSFRRAHRSHKNQPGASRLSLAQPTMAT
ncbi:hypothetical protein DFH09DRAFT_597926 [Mycena vulgaris]|nr:hypothetical protein DFH09DRAFT_597926 [Mycena vulgaris]